MLTKAIVEKQEHIGLACQTGQTQARAKSGHALGETGVGNLQRGLQERSQGTESVTLVDQSERGASDSDLTRSRIVNTSRAGRIVNYMKHE
jgi:hypothetical protein